MNKKYSTFLTERNIIELPTELFTKYKNQELYLLIYEEDGLQVYTNEKWKEYQSTLKNLPLQEQKLLRPLFTAAEQVVVTQNTISIPGHLVEFMSLDGSKGVDIIENDKGFILKPICTRQTIQV